MRDKLLGPLILLVAWYLLSASGAINPLFLPLPHVVLQKWGILATDLAYWGEIGTTTWRILVGMVISAGAGVPLGLFLGSSSRILAITQLPVDFLRSLPAIAMYPLFTIFFGLGTSSKVATTVFACGLVIMINSVYGAMNAKQRRAEAALLMGATRLELFRLVTLRDALPDIFAGLRIALSLAVIVIVVTEMFIGSDGGVGSKLVEAQLAYRMPEYYVWLGTTGLLGYGLNRIFLHGETTMIHWRGQQ